MTEKLEYYDVLGTLVPGVLLISWVPICFPETAAIASSPGFPGAFGVIVCLAVAIFIGQIVQALGSIVEPILFWSWGGRPSDQALEGGLGRYLPRDSSARIQQKLSAKVGQEASTHSLFLYAMQLSDAAGVGRATRFNGLYAYHRSQVVLVLLAMLVAVASWFAGRVSSWYWWHAGGLVLSLIVLLVLAWYRAKQRSIYYVREVLLTAEKLLDERKTETRRY